MLDDIQKYALAINAKGHLNDNSPIEGEQQLLLVEQESYL
jgi:hypothetical protein